MKGRDRHAGQAVTVIVQLKVKPGKEARVREELENLFCPTRAEKGCLNYDMHQAPHNASLFLFHETWVSEDDLKRHFEAPHIKHWLHTAEALLAEPIELTLWHKMPQ